MFQTPGPIWIFFIYLISIIPACGSGNAQQAGVAGEGSCKLISAEQNFGTDGNATLKSNAVVSGLEVPWGIAFLSEEQWLVTERPGRVRLVESGKLIEEPVATLEVGESGEGGLLGIALDPNFESNRFFYLYFTEREGNANRVERFRLAENRRSATRDRLVIGEIPARSFHNGGRIQFGPDGFLYIATGDAGVPENSQNNNSLAGKILRVTGDGSIPDDNPFGSDNAAYVTGVRNVQGFDWLEDGTLIVTDHGPSGELGRTGGDEISLARAGENLGWPEIWKCEEREGMVTPIVAWEEALPPGGAILVEEGFVEGWGRSLMIGTLASRHLHRYDLSSGENEVYFRGDPPEGLGRLRDATLSPSGALLVTTSNCDGRGSCPETKDAIVRVNP